MLTVLYYASGDIIFVTVCGSVVNSGLWLGKQQNYTDKIEYYYSGCTGIWIGCG